MSARKKSQEPLKDEDAPHPVPPIWRPTLRAIAEAFAQGDYALERGIDSVAPVSAKLARRIKEYVQRYGETLTEKLPAQTWRSSVTQWMDGFWDVLVDLWTLESGASDLVLFVRVFETNRKKESSGFRGYRFEIDSVHVP